MVVAVVLAVVFTRPGGGSGSGELFAETANSTGQNPVTQSTAKISTPSPSATPKQSPGSTNSTVSGSTAGLYGGTQNNASCDVEKQIKYLQSAPAKNEAFAGALGLKPGEVPAYLRSLTSVQLAYDTRVTNHGYKDGKIYPFQSVLQAGTAVMVDSYGVPKVRCKCGNPLTAPQALKDGVQTRGQTWPGYQATHAVVVKPAADPVKDFTLRDPKTGEWFKRPKGDSGPSYDQPTAPPTETPSGPASSEPPPYGSTPPGETTNGPSGTSPTEPGTSGTGDTGTTGTEHPTETTGGTSTTGGTTSGPEQPPGSTTGGSSEGGGSTPGNGGSTGGETTGGESTGGGSTGGGSAPGGSGSVPSG